MTKLDTYPALSTAVSLRAVAVAEPPINSTIQLPHEKQKRSRSGLSPLLRTLGAIPGKFVLIILSVLVLSISTQAQTPSFAPTSSRPADQLEQLLSPIALYPDPLIALILPASIVQTDLSSAVAYLNSVAIADPALIEVQPWDPSVKSLAHYPDIIRWLYQNPAWTSALGVEFINQPEAVMKTIQHLRRLALNAGTLVDTPQQKVLVEGGEIRILPAEPQTIYVPQYDPNMVYAAPPPGYIEPMISFAWGYPAGPWLTYDCDWDHSGIWVGGWVPGWNHRPGWRHTHVLGFNGSHGHQWRPDPYRAHLRPDLDPGHHHVTSVQPPVPFVAHAEVAGRIERAMQPERVSGRHQPEIVQHPTSHHVEVVRPPSTSPERGPVLHASVAPLPEPNFDRTNQGTSVRGGIDRGQANREVNPTVIRNEPPVSHRETTIQRPVSTPAFQTPPPSYHAVPSYSPPAHQTAPASAPPTYHPAPSYQAPPPPPLPTYHSAPAYQAPPSYSPPVHSAPSYQPAPSYSAPPAHSAPSYSPPEPSHSAPPASDGHQRK